MPVSYLNLLFKNERFQALSMLLNATPYAFVVDLACLASRREYLKLDKWLSDKISEHKVISHPFTGSIPTLPPLHDEPHTPSIAPSSKLCQIWLRHRMGTLYLCTAVHQCGQRPQKGLGTNVTENNLAPKNPCKHEMHPLWVKKRSSVSIQTISVWHKQCGQLRKKRLI